VGKDSKRRRSDQPRTRMEKRNEARARFWGALRNRSRVSLIAVVGELQKAERGKKERG